MGLPDFGGVPGHPYCRPLALAFAAGLVSFVALVTLDAVYRPPLFDSMFWRD